MSKLDDILKKAQYSNYPDRIFILSEDEIAYLLFSEYIKKTAHYKSRYIFKSSSEPRILPFVGCYLYLRK